MNDGASLVELYQALAGRGMLIGSSGNVSARAQDGMLITPSGCKADGLTHEHLVSMRLDGRGLRAGDRPSSEWEMHAAIYLAAPEAQVIAHTHSDHATGLSCLNLPLPAFHYNVAEFGGEDVRCAAYATFGTPELARLAAEAIAGRSACLLANHGMICHAADAKAALTACLRLEALCRQYLLARAAGRPRLLTRDEMTDARARYQTYGAPP